jgi:tRNA (mo5U34)-methyltransferase
MPESRPRQKTISDIRWFHQIDLGNGVITPGESPNAKMVKNMRFPADLTGKTFLDIGAWDGFYSFEAEKRGAKRVLATDSFIWQNKSWASKDGFDFAKRALNSKVEEMTIDSLDISPETVGLWDVVFYSGVLYHMKHPMLSLERAASVAKELLILQSMTDMGWHMRPAIAFYPGSELRGDPTNWCGPNLRCIKAMLKLCGFTRIELVNRKSIAWKVYHALKWRQISELQRNRVVVHAYR